MSWGMGNYLPSLDLPAPTTDQLRKMVAKHVSAPATLKADKSNTRDERRMAIQGPPSDLKATGLSTTVPRFSVAKSLSTYSVQSPIPSTLPASPANDDSGTRTRTSFATFIESYTLRDLVDSPSKVPPVPALPPMTSMPTRMFKCEPALLELLNTERSYALELGLIRDLHIPLAQGLPVVYPASSLSSVADLSRSSIHTAPLTLSDPSTPSRVMSNQDIHIIFRNAPELASFAESFSNKVDAALRGITDNDRGNNRIGGLFLEIVAEMDPLYTTYITRHPTALAHLNSLSSSDNIQRYLARTWQLTSSRTNSWDLQALLTRPVQRLLEYPTLFQALIDDTPDSYLDHARLLQANKRLEALARGAHEYLRQLEVDKHLFDRRSPAIPATVKKLISSTSLWLLRVGGRSKFNDAPVKETPTEQEQLEQELQGFTRSATRNNGGASFETRTGPCTLLDLVNLAPDVLRPPQLLPLTLATPMPGTCTSKRERALLELLNTERSYASEIALIRDVHIPLARGQPASFLIGPSAFAANTPESSRSSTPTASSTPSDTPAQSAPMTNQDIQIIFNNISELVLFTEIFSDKLEVALGEVITGGRGKDHVGALFLEIFSEMSALFMKYITRHPTALRHLNSLSSNAILQQYLAQTRQLVSTHTHAWELRSLLVKPVQRLLEYQTLIDVLVNETPDSHPDQPTLRHAKEKIEAFTRGIDEHWRRAEVVKRVLEGRPPAILVAVKKSASSTSAGRVRSFSINGDSKRNDAQFERALAEQKQMEQMEQRLRKLETCTSSMSHQILAWSQAVRDGVGHLGHWATGFGRVIGLGPHHGSESLTAFGDVVEEQILSLWADLDVALHSVLVPQLCAMVSTASGPHILLAHWRDLRPNHEALVHTPYAKIKPTAAQLEMEVEYGAIGAQLRAEMPRYLELMERGLALAVRRFAMWQHIFWREVSMRWAALWEALGIEGGGDAKTLAAETARVWWERWEKVEQMVGELALVNPAVSPIPPRPPTSASSRRPTSASSSQPSFSHQHTQPQPIQRAVSPHPTHVRASHSISESSIASGTDGHGLPRGQRGRKSDPDELHTRTRPRPMIPHPREASEIDSASIAMSDGFDVDGAEDVLRALALGDPAFDLQDDYDFNNDGHGRRPSHMRGFSYLQPAGSRSQSRTRPELRRESCSMPYSSMLVNLDSRQPVLYSCTTVQTCTPTTAVRYGGLPFLVLAIGDIVGVLIEGGHPASIADEVPIIPPPRGDEDDAMLVVRDEIGRIGWALASFLLPLTS